MVPAGRWPNLRPLLQSSRIGHDNLDGYVAAASLTEFLAERGGKTRVVEFARSGQRYGWDKAAGEFYGVASVADLQVAWQSWAAKQRRTSAKHATRPRTADRNANRSRRPGCRRGRAR